MKFGTKLYFLAAFVVLVVFLAATVLSASFPPVSQNTATTLLENVIRLNGMLFGFSAVMVGLVFGTLQEKNKKLRSKYLLFALCAFLSFLLSIFVSFSYLMQSQSDGLIFAPVVLTCFGGICSSVYIVVTYLWEEEKKE